MPKKVTEDAAKIHFAAWKVLTREVDLDEWPDDAWFGFEVDDRKYDLHVHITEDDVGQILKAQIYDVEDGETQIDKGWINIVEIIGPKEVWGPDRSHAPDCGYQHKGECTCPKGSYVEKEEGCPNCDGTGRDSCPLCSGTNKAFPEEENTKREDVPEDILEALEVDTLDATSLDGSVHDEKGAEAAAINNDGSQSQIEYLRSNGWSWTDIRKSLGLSSSEEGDRPSETGLAHERMRDKYGEGS